MASVYDPRLGYGAPPAPLKLPTASPPPPPSWLTPSTQTTTASGAAGSTVQPPVIPQFPGGQQAFVDPAKALAQIQALLPPPPTIVAPVVQPAQVNVPGLGPGGAYQQSIYESQFSPIQRELTRQGGIADERTAALMAQAGLADSGTGIGQRLDVAREYDQRLESASSDISAAATAQAIQAQIAVETQNAQLAQQASLANAGFDYQAQASNAQNILQGNLAAADGYLKALGISAQQASMWTDAYLRYFSEADRNRILKDQALQQYHGEWLNYLIQKEKIANDRDVALQQLDLQSKELEQQEQLEIVKNQQQESQFTRELAFAYAQLAQQQKPAAPTMDRRLVYDNAGPSAYDPTNAYGTPFTPYGF